MYLILKTWLWSRILKSLLWWCLTQKTDQYLADFLPTKSRLPVSQENWNITYHIFRQPFVKFDSSLWLMIWVTCSSTFASANLSRSDVSRTNTRPSAVNMYFLQTRRAVRIKYSYICHNIIILLMYSAYFQSVVDWSGQKSSIYFQFAPQKLQLLGKLTKPNIYRCFFTFIWNIPNHFAIIQQLIFVHEFFDLPCLWPPRSKAVSFKPPNVSSSESANINFWHHIGDM